MQITPYLTFNGNCAEAFRFYEQTLGGHIDAMVPHRGTPAAEHVDADWQDKIMHASLSVGGAAALMASDAPPPMFEQPQGFSVSLHYPDRAEGERVFNALAAGGTVRMPFQETFWASGFGMLVDRFGTPWMVNCDKPA